VTGQPQALLSGRVALVTGASRGIGAGIARALGRHGAAVAVNFLANRTAAEEVVTDITADGTRAVAVRADATDDEQVAAMVAEVTDTLGEIDILVCNAAVDTAGMAQRIREHTSVLDRAVAVQEAVRTQLDAVFAACRHTVPGMRERQRGTIVLIGSSTSRTTSPRAQAVEVAVAKAAQDALGRHLAAELGAAGIRVNTIAPGFVLTDAHGAEVDGSLAEEIARTAPTGRVSTPSDVGNMVVLLASDLARQVTGAAVTVDGGSTMS
jgi:3-oxoacyl-[acyl-carrier protein] reductase